MRKIWMGVSLLASAVASGPGVPGHVALAFAQEIDGNSNPKIINETDHRAPVDYGFGPGVRSKPRAAAAAMAPAAAAAAGDSTATVPTGGPDAGTQGYFAPAVGWPLIGLHSVLLPDGRVMNYGTDEQGQQGGQFVYDVWDPTVGTGSESHLTLENTTETDIFCSAQSVLPGTGQVLITGGDATVDGVRNYSNEQTELFDPETNTLTSIPAMAYARWYPTAIDLANGEVLILGGRQSPDVDAPTPEIYNTSSGWRTLPGASSVPALGFPNGNWYYTRAFLAPSSKVVVLSNWKEVYSITPRGAGAITQFSSELLPGDYELPAVMYAPGKVLSLRLDRKVNLVNIGANPPVVTTTNDVDQVRYWANTTVLPNGRVLVTGGSAVANELQGVAYTAQIWNPTDGSWTTGAAATKPRLYHSIALLLPDGSVLTGAGGAPGPVNNLNAEIYYPPYLYKNNGTGQPATRPTLLSTPDAVAVGETFTATVGANTKINRVAMVRTGSVTHAFNPDQRFFGPAFTQNGQALTITMPTNKQMVLPGYYMLFVLKGGVPSIAKIIRVTA